VPFFINLCKHVIRNDVRRESLDLATREFDFINIHVSSKGLSFATPMGRPSLSFSRFVTLPYCGSLSGPCERASSIVRYVSNVSGVNSSCLGIKS
jgi:hypothetical protein